MSTNPTFNSFSFNDVAGGIGWLTERVTFKEYASREVIRANINRREGVKLLATEFREKKVQIDGRVAGSSASDLQSKLDAMKLAATQEEGALVLENGRTFTATVDGMVIPDEHYSLTTAPFTVTFMLSKPFAEGAAQSSTTPVTSGYYTFSGLINISGSLFNRPQLVYTPPAGSGPTFIKQLVFSHTPTGQTVTISGFGASTSLNYVNPVTIDFDKFISLEGTSLIGNTGAFPRWAPGNNAYTITSSGRAFPGGSVTVVYDPRYL